MQKTHLYGVLLTLLVSAAVPGFSQDNYYQKVPKLIPQADGSYRVADGEFYFVPVSKEGAANPVKTASQASEENSVQLEEGTSLGTIISQHPATMVVEKNKKLPGRKPYIGLGLALMRSEANLDDDYVASDTSIIKDTKPSVKFSFGERITNYLRAEVFYQYRQKIDDTFYKSSVSMRMQDLGANLFVYVNPNDNTRLFAGLGIAGTRVKVEVNDFSATKWFPTPSFFIGTETPLNSKTDIDITAFYSHTIVHKWDVQNIETYGLAVSLRFNFLEKRITYIK